MRRTMLFLSVLALGFAARAEGRSEGVRIRTNRGIELDGLADRPEKPNGLAVVLAPGRGYHMALPLLKECAARLAGAGFLAVRFDWAYTTAKGEPSADLRTELDDLEAAIAFARGQPGVRRVLLAGKSMGSVLALVRAVAKPRDLAGVALLTLPVQEGGPSDQLKDLKIPSVIVNGDADTICPLRPLYSIAAGCEETPTLVIVPGDHSFREGEDRAKEAANIAFAADALVLWASRRV